MGEARNRSYKSKARQGLGSVDNTHNRDLWRAQENLSRAPVAREVLLREGDRLNRAFVRRAAKLGLRPKELIAAKGIVQEKQRRIDPLKRMVIKSVTKALEDTDVPTT